MSIQTIRIPLQSVDFTPFIKEGDTIKKITFEFAATDTINLTGATISMQLYQDGVETLSIDTTSGITIESDKIFSIDDEVGVVRAWGKGVGGVTEQKILLVVVIVIVEKGE